MKKSDILALINGCSEKIQKALKKDNLSKTQKARLEKLLKSTEYHAVHVNMEVKSDDKETLAKYEKHFKDLDAQLNIILKSKAPKKSKNSKKKKVKKVISEKEQKESTKKKRGILKKVLIFGGSAIVLSSLIFNLTQCSKQNDNDEDLDLDTRPGYEQTDPNYTKPTTPIVRPIDVLDLEDPEQLVEYATLIQEELGETKLTKDDIMYAIRLANFDKLEDKAQFKDREGVYVSANAIGEIVTKLGSDSIVRKNTSEDTYLTEAQLKDILTRSTDGKLNVYYFSTAKVNDKYDIYNIADLCIQGLNSDSENKVLYAKVFNELITNEALEFNIAPNSPISTRYVLAGMYNANMKKIIELTERFGPIYGKGTRIDGTNGFICVEELTAYMYIGNPNNILYTEVIDQNITNYAQGVTK